MAPSKLSRKLQRVSVPCLHRQKIGHYESKRMQPTHVQEPKKENESAVIDNVFSSPDTTKSAHHRFLLPSALSPSALVVAPHYLNSGEAKADEVLPVLAAEMDADHLAMQDSRQEDIFLSAKQLIRKKEMEINQKGRKGCWNYYIGDCIGTCDLELVHLVIADEGVKSQKKTQGRTYCRLCSEKYVKHDPDVRPVQSDDCSKLEKRRRSSISDRIDAYLENASRAVTAHRNLDCVCVLLESFNNVASARLGRDDECLAAGESVHGENVESEEQDAPNHAGVDNLEEQELKRCLDELEVGIFKTSTTVVDLETHKDFLGKHAFWWKVGV